MAREPQKPVPTRRVLVKMRPSPALRAAETRVSLEPLEEGAMAAGFGLDATPRWFAAELPDGADTPWGLAHAQVAAQLGVAESDVVFAEPDLLHDVFRDTEDAPPGQPLAMGDNCTADAQDARNGKAVGPDRFGWHLEDAFSQLAGARGEVDFTEPRTRIGHLDTGYFPEHKSTPRHVLRDLERNFVHRDDDPRSAADPDNRRLLLDNSGHGCGTLSILAGGEVPASNGIEMGGAPEAEVLPLRVADSVVLLRTSALARALFYAIEQRCDVLTMSMGGLPSAAWEDAVDRVYEAGICFCAAAGNHTGSLPPRTLVYPARYARVIAVCGVMADDSPYADLRGRTLEGSFGPESAMGTAMAAYTPNIPWARFGCPEIVRRNGEGTSSATPQVAAAAALWIEKHKRRLPRDYQRVEAVRRALFSSAKLRGDKEHFGNGVLQAAKALEVAPVLRLPKSPRASSRFAFLRLVTGLGFVEPPPRERMYELEIAQRWLLDEELQELVPDPEATAKLSKRALRRFMEAVIEDPGASRELRKHVAARYPVAAGRSVPRNEGTADVVPAEVPACREQPQVSDPPYRRIRVYAVDPSLSQRLATAGFNEIALPVRWEKLDPGPVGEYLEVEDTDAAGVRYPGVDLDDPRLLGQDGWAPSEGNPQFHQQMIYAVAMKTIEHFERALGRPVLWRPRPTPGKPFDDSEHVRRLRVHPHALRQANAFYSPDQVALLFGYFEAAADDPGDHVPGSRVYSCLSHDIVAHETTHAILDGMHRRFNQPSNPDVLALHEAFADIVALLQHFTMREVLENEIARTRGDLEMESLLGSLAIEFGRATGGRGALRQAIGKVEDGVWKRLVPDPTALHKLLTPHSRGAVLVAAVFDAFLAIYEQRVADLLRLASGGTGVLPEGAIHPDLVRRLAEEAAKSAGHVLTMCIRAVDYLPPVDVTFFEYLRALITADFDLVRDDRHNYRVAFVEAFRRRGIYPLDMGTPSADTPLTLSVDRLRWQAADFPTKPHGEVMARYYQVLESLMRYADTALYLDDREYLFKVTRRERIKLHAMLTGVFKEAPELAAPLGVDPSRSFEVHELRPAMRVGPDGRHVPQVVVALTQSERVNGEGATPRHELQGGSTLIVDLVSGHIKYCIYKRLQSPERRARTASFVRETAADPLRALFFAPDRKEPFAALHALGEEGL